MFGPSFVVVCIFLVYCNNLTWGNALSHKLKVGRRHSLASHYTNHYRQDCFYSVKILQCTRLCFVLLSRDSFTAAVHAYQAIMQSAKKCRVIQFRHCYRIHLRGNLESLCISASVHLLLSDKKYCKVLHVLLLVTAHLLQLVPGSGTLSLVMLLLQHRWCYFVKNLRHTYFGSHILTLLCDLRHSEPCSFLLWPL